MVTPRRSFLKSFDWTRTVIIQLVADIFIEVIQLELLALDSSSSVIVRVVFFFHLRHPLSIGADCQDLKIISHSVSFLEEIVP